MDYPTFIGRDCFFIMIDVDRFKHFNDTEGHNSGDRVLLQTAGFTRQRSMDAAG